MLQLAFCVLLSAGAAAELMDVRVATVTLTLRRPDADRLRGPARARADAPAPARRRRRRRLGRGGAAASPTTASRPPRCATPSRPTRRSCATATAIRRADLLERCRIVADVRPGARRGRPRALGPRRQPRGQAGQRADLRRPRPPRCASTRRSRPRTARTPPSRRAAAASAGYTCVKVKVGIGDDAGRRGRRARRGRPADGAAPGRQRRLGGRRGGRVDQRARAGRARARRGARPRRRSAMRQVRDRVAVRVAMDETARPAGLADRQGRRRGVPEGLALRRDLAAAGPGRARARLGRRRLPRLDLRRAARHRRRRPLRRGAEDHRGLRAGDARAVRRRAHRLPVEDGAIAVPAQPGLGV